MGTVPRPFPFPFPGSSTLPRGDPESAFTIVHRPGTSLAFVSRPAAADRSRARSRRVPAADSSTADAPVGRVGLQSRRAHLPSQLSGGEMQLAAIARALVKKPALVLADEPTGNVNVETGRRILALLFDVLREAGAALLLVTHHPE